MPVKPAQLRHRKGLPEERKDGSAIHHGGFKQEASAFFCSQSEKLSVGEDHRTLVGGDGMHAQAQGCAQVLRGWFAGMRIDRGIFEQGIGGAGGE